MYTTNWQVFFKDFPQAKVGDYIQGDEWHMSCPIVEGDEVDEQTFGTRLRVDLRSDIIPSLPIKVEITGRKVYVDAWNTKMRCKITTWDMEEEPITFGGWIYLGKKRNER